MTQTTVNLPFVTADASGPKHLNVDLMRSTFEQLTADLVERCLGPVQQAMADAKVTADDIDEVILVGGSTRIPAVQNLVRRLTGGKDPNMTVNPDEVVAIGAAIQAGDPQGRGQGRPAARRHAAVAGPGDARRRDDQGHRAQHDDPGAPHRDLQHRRGQPARGRRRGAAGRAGARAPTTGCSADSGWRTSGRRRAGCPQIEVTFDIDANGILNVSARDKDTGAEQRITISETSNLDQAEIERMVADAEPHRGEDAALREQIDARNELDTVAYQVGGRWTSTQDAIPEHERARAELLLNDARSALEEQADIDRLRALTGELQQLLQSLAASARSRRHGWGVRGSDGTSPRESGGDDSDDVIDAEFTAR